ncbi:hypothetical protein [Rhodocyclus tenuis]|uniref:hypothetical protein n=1 Tax=Rhodocyclus tenuis TaxID=1066 RepID=UPI0019030F91|nr:hypothetical protein [Rhodocyclus tenuis]
MMQAQAGRVGCVQLLPLAEQQNSSGPGSYPINSTRYCFAAPVQFLLIANCYPPTGFPNYVATDLERDVRQMIAQDAAAK